MTYVDVMVLEADKLKQILAIFPRSATRLRKKVVRLALRRHLVAYKNTHRSNIDSASNHEVGTGSHQTSFMGSMSHANLDGVEERNSLDHAAEPPGKAASETSSRWCCRQARKGDHVDAELRDGETARQAAIELALLLQDQQISQSEWRAGGSGGGGEAGVMAHSEIMKALQALGEKVDGVHRQMGSLEQRFEQLEQKQEREARSRLEREVVVNSDGNLGGGAGGSSTRAVPSVARAASSTPVTQSSLAASDPTWL